jgi:odorant receptor
MIMELIQIWLPCYYGNELKFASEKISMSMFHSDWSTTTKSFKTAMKIFMENNKKSTWIRAFGYIKIDLTTFISICNFAYSLYAVFKKN